MALDYAGPATFVQNGRPFVEIEECSISRASHSTTVRTLALGTAGRTKGSPEYQIKCKSAVPLAGYENNWLDLIESQDIVTIGIRAAGREDTFKMWIDTDDETFAVNTPIGQNATFTGFKIASHPI